MKAKLDQVGPICIYGLCEALGVAVRFNNINMEGMYQRGLPPRIHLSARRPLPRRAYNCAQELGHHVFSHGSSIDELRGPENYVSPNDQAADPTTVTVRKLGDGEAFTIPPGQFAFLLTEEIVSVPADALAFISIRA